MIAIAHRGEPIGHRENTMAGFARAVALGTDMVEIDLRCCVDGTIVVLHDETLDRLWHVNRPVAQMTGAEVAAVAHRGRSIPTFSEVLAEVNVPLMVDFTRSDVVTGAVAATRQAHAMERCLFVSGNFEALRHLRHEAPEARIGMTWMRPTVPDAPILAELSPEFWNPPYQLVSPERVAAVHALGLSASTWTIDDTATMSAMASAGVDAIVTNRIARLRTFVDRGSTRARP